MQVPARLCVSSLKGSLKSIKDTTFSVMPSLAWCFYFLNAIRAAFKIHITGRATGPYFTAAPDSSYLSPSPLTSADFARNPYLNIPLCNLFIWVNLHESWLQSIFKIPLTIRQMLQTSSSSLCMQICKYLIPRLQPKSKVF